jgi:hypothetical protein
MLESGWGRVGGSGIRHPLTRFEAAARANTSRTGGAAGPNVSNRPETRLPVLADPLSAPERLSGTQATREPSNWVHDREALGLIVRSNGGLILPSAAGLVKCGLITGLRSAQEP